MAIAPRLHVEGKNDQFVIANLLKEHGLELSPEGLDPQRPIIESAKTADGKTADVSRLIQTMDSKIKVSERPIGFVFDADPDVGLASRWQSIRDRLDRSGVDSPIEIPATGFVGESVQYKIQVGVWLMPDNRRDGTLETFLKDLIKDGDPLINHACGVTAQAATIDQRFRNVDKPKADLYTWLAWQRTPGVPYGTAVSCKYFEAGSPLAQDFVSWFRKLYRL